MALLFNVIVLVINKHIKNIILKNELNEESTISKIEIVQYEGNSKVIYKHIKRYLRLLKWYKK